MGSFGVPHDGHDNVRESGRLRFQSFAGRDCPSAASRAMRAARSIEPGVGGGGSIGT
jgi:hypothetical protein